MADETEESLPFYNYNDLLQLAHNAGFQGPAADTIARISLAESSGNPLAKNLNDPGGSFGLLQINQAAHPGTEQEAFQPQQAFNLAYDISKGGTDFRPWSTYKSGAYEGVLKGTRFGTGLGGSNILSAEAQPFQASEYPSFKEVSSEGPGPSDLPNVAINLPMGQETGQPGVNPIFLLGLIQSMMKGTTFTPVDYDPWKVVGKT